MKLAAAVAVAIGQHIDTLMLALHDLAMCVHAQPDVGRQRLLSQ
jgi:hypothetical protein